jgi:hypothetical protein
MAHCTFAWDADPSVGVAGYRVFYGTSPGTYSASVDVGLILITSIYGLVLGTTYYAAVQALDGGGLLMDSLSNESSGVARPDPYVCKRTFIH